MSGKRKEWGYTYWQKPSIPPFPPLSTCSLLNIKLNNNFTIPTGKCLTNYLFSFQELKIRIHMHTHSDTDRPKRELLDASKMSDTVPEINKSADSEELWGFPSLFKDALQTPDLHLLCKATLKKTKNKTKRTQELEHGVTKVMMFLMCGFMFYFFLPAGCTVGCVKQNLEWSTEVKLLDFRTPKF